MTPNIPAMFLMDQQFQCNFTWNIICNVGNVDVSKRLWKLSHYQWPMGYSL